jgi:hypothetical protein
MITREVLATVADLLAEHPGLPSDIGAYTWGCVPATVREVGVPVERASPIIAANGARYAAEAPAMVRIRLTHRVPLTGVPNVAVLKFGFDAKARIVCWSCE